MEEQHLEPLRGDKDSILDEYDSSDADSSIEITSTIDETENELVRLSTYLQLESEDEDENEDERNFEWPHPPSSLSSSSSSDVDEANDGSLVTIRTLQGFIFDPSTVTSSTISIDDNQENDDEDEEIEESNPRATVTKDQNPHTSTFKNNMKMKQFNLNHFIKK